VKEAAIQWVYLTGLGERKQDHVTELDRLTAMCFDSKGTHLAVGDKGGRVIVFK
jgi:hypothetical protein